MKQIGIRGAVRGKVVKTTVPDTSAPSPRDKVNRVFRAPAPNLLWVSDFTYVSTRQGFVYVAFVIDTFADRIVGPLSADLLCKSPDGQWDESRGRPRLTLFSPLIAASSDCRAMDALEQALHDRRPVQKSGLVHHSDRPSRDIVAQCPAGQWAGNVYPFAIPSVWPKQALNHRSAASGIPIPLMHVNMHCRAMDNALAETINGLYKTELVHRQGPWRNMQDLEMATLGWVDWFNNRRLLGPIGNIPPAEAEQNYYAQRDVFDMVA